MVSIASDSACVHQSSAAGGPVSILVSADSTQFVCIAFTTSRKVYTGVPDASVRTQTPGKCSMAAVTT